VIRAIELRKRYGQTEAVRGVSFDVGQGEILGLLGPNGAGKTSIMKVLTGYHFPDEGQALVNGMDVTEDPLGVKRAVGYLPESAPLYPDLTPEEYLSFMADSRGLQGNARARAVDRAVEACGLATVFRRPVDQLSKGYRQRLGLAQAILHDPSVLILDEPTTGLDPNQILEIRSLIRELGREKTVILSTHILQEVEATCSRVVILNGGLVAAQGSPDEIGEAMKGEERLSLRLKARGGRPAKADLAASLASLDGVRAVTRAEASPTSPSVFEAEIVLSRDRSFPDGPGELVFDWAVSKGYALLEMSRHRLSLEEIFVQLTQEGGRK
jgi:ABC-2 type transport system ATP-binding protein